MSNVSHFSYNTQITVYDIRNYFSQLLTLSIVIGAWQKWYHWWTHVEVVLLQSQLTTLTICEKKLCPWHCSCLWTKFCVSEQQWWSRNLPLRQQRASEKIGKKHHHVKGGCHDSNMLDFEILPSPPSSLSFSLQTYQKLFSWQNSSFLWQSLQKTN